ncbi:MAG: hypothetical protein V7K54_07540 [Nostoc sp.]
MKKEYLSREKIRTLDEFKEEYFRKHPEEIDDYLSEIFSGIFRKQRFWPLLASLRLVVRVKELYK